MIILLDENFPLALYTRLQKEGFQAEHILLGQRGLHDSQIMARLRRIAEQASSGLKSPSQSRSKSELRFGWLRSTNSFRRSGRKNFFKSTMMESYILLKS
jgi:hypothetical protein